VTVFHEPIPDFIYKSDAIADGPRIDFCEDRMEIHGPTPAKFRESNGFEPDGLWVSRLLS
jgi:hypothetical protein